MNLTTAIAERLKLDTIATTFTLGTPRNGRIIAHYQREIDCGHMDQYTALERCLGDLMGRNYHPSLDQHSTVRI